MRGVFGNEVKGRNRKERASMAYNDQNANQKRNDAINYVKELYESSGSPGASILCIFYNATGETLYNKDGNSKSGEFYSTSASEPYPNLVQNGEWGAFLHHGKDSKSSVGLVVYRVEANDKSDHSCKQVLGWKTPSDKPDTPSCKPDTPSYKPNTHAYCGIFEDAAIIYEEVYNKLERRKEPYDKDTKFNMTTEVKAYQEATIPLFEAKFLIEN